MVFGDSVFARFTESGLHNGNYDRNQRNGRKSKAIKNKSLLTVWCVLI